MKKSSLVIGGLVLALSMSGCSSKAPETPKTAETSKTADQGSTEAKTEEKTEAGGEKQKVVFWSWQPTDKQIAALEPAFEAAYPDIDLEYWRGELPDYQKKLQVAIASGEGPDLMGMQTGAMLNQYSKFLEPLNSAADEAFGAGWEDGYLENALNECKDANGNYVALPVNVSAQQFVLYNKTLFDEAGITKTPETYEEWKEIVEILRGKYADIVPVVYGAKEADKCVDMFNALSQQFGPGKFYEAEAGTIPWTDQVFVDTMTAWKQMFDDKIFQDGAIGLQMYPDASIKYFFDRKAAMFMTGSWQTGALQEGGPKFNGATNNDEFGMFILPQIGPSEPKAVVSTDIAVAINKDAKNKEAAQILLEFMVYGEGNQIMADQLSGTSANKAVSPRTLDNFKAESERAIVPYTTEKIQEGAGKRFLNDKELVNALGVAMQDVVTGKDINKALAEVQSAYEKMK